MEAEARPGPKLARSAEGAEGSVPRGTHHHGHSPLRVPSTPL